MRLPSKFDALRRLDLGMVILKAAILERRLAIRNHRDQKLDDRCWLDDYDVWIMLEYSVLGPTQLSLHFDEMIEICTCFYGFRRAELPDPIPPDAIVNEALWDLDLEGASEAELLDKLLQIQNAIRAHYDIGLRPRTIDDDRQLYAVLPEKLPADFRLPKREEFLGDAAAPNAGCPSFWRSHQKCLRECDSCTLSAWGPCFSKNK